MQRTGRVLSYTASTSVSQLLDLSQDVVACLVVHVNPFGISASQMRQAIWVDFRTERARCWPAIFELPRNLSGSALGGAIDGRCDEDHLFKLLAQRLLPALVREVMALVQQPIYRQAAPATADKGFGKGALGPAIRSAIRGRPSCGSMPSDPKEAAASSSGVCQRLPVQLAAPWLKAPHTRSFLITAAQRWAPWGHGLALHPPR